MAHRDFDVEHAERVAHATTFTLGGEEFRVHPDPAQDDILVAMRFEEVYSDAVDNGKVTRELVEHQQEAARMALAAMIYPDDRDRFIDTLKQKRIGIRRLNDLSQWLQEEITGRPTSPSSDSSNGDGNPPTGTVSTGGYWQTVPVPSETSPSEIAST